MTRQILPFPHRIHIFFPEQCNHVRNLWPEHPHWILLHWDFPSTHAPVISMTPKSISDPPDHISARDRAISGNISPNQSHLTSGPYLHFSISSVHSGYDMPCSTLVLVPLCRYLRAVCTAPAFVPLVCSSGYCTSCSPTYSSAPPPLIILCFSIVYKLLDTPLYSSLNID